MRSGVYIYHLFHRNLRIDLRSRQTRVAEEFLNVAKVGARVEQMRREGVPQAVRRDVMNVCALLDVFVDHPADAARC